MAEAQQLNAIEMALHAMEVDTVLPKVKAVIGDSKQSELDAKAIEIARYAIDPAAKIKLKEKVNNLEKGNTTIDAKKDLLDIKDLSRSKAISEEHIQELIAKAKLKPETMSDKEVLDLMVYGKRGTLAMLVTTELEPTLKG